MKLVISEAVMKQLPGNSETIQEVINTWWYTKSGDSLRLSTLGDYKFREANIEFFDLPIKSKQLNWYSFLNECNNKIKCPYFFGVNSDVGSKFKDPFIRIYDSKIAMMLTLYGDIESYLASVKTRK